MERRVYQCDICGTERGQTNQWFVAVIEGRANGQPKLTIQPMRGQEAPRDGQEFFHLCCFKCVLKCTSDFLDWTLKQNTGGASDSVKL